MQTTPAQTRPSIVVERMDHVAVAVTDVNRARRFYAEVLGLPEIDRPESFDFPGAWFQCGPEVIHLLGNPQALPRGRPHFCLRVTDIESAAAHIAAAGCEVAWDRKYKIGGVDRFFTSDPDGNRIELQGRDGGMKG